MDFAARDGAEFAMKSRLKHVSPTRLLPFLLAFMASNLFAAAPAQTLSGWQGEYLNAKEGAFYFVLKSKDFNPPLDSASRVVLLINNLLTKDSYVTSQKLEGNEEKFMPIWKAPSGKYVISGLMLIDGKGRKRQWRSAQKMSFLIKRLFISNLGTWTITPGPSEALSVDMKVGPNLFKEKGDKSESSVAGVINGFSGLEQETIAGNALVKKAQDNYGSPGELRAAYTIRRQIAMFFALNLFKDNNNARGVADILKVYDPQMRSCYTDRLEEKDGLRGTVGFKFVLSKQSQGIRSLKHVGGTLGDPPLVKCLFDILAGSTIPVNNNMIGELTYTFDVK